MLVAIGHGTWLYIRPLGEGSPFHEGGFKGKWRGEEYAHRHARVAKWLQPTRMIEMQVPYNHRLHVFDIVPCFRNLRRETHRRLVVHARKDIIDRRPDIRGVILL